MQYIASDASDELRKIKATATVRPKGDGTEPEDETNKCWEILQDVQKISKTSLEATTEAFGTLSNTSQAIAAEMLAYSKRSYESGSKALQDLFGVKSLDKAIEVQSEYAKSAFEDYSAQLEKLRPALRRSGQGDFQANRSSDG